MKTAIVLQNLKFYAYHGVLDQERTVGADYTLSLRIESDFRVAMNEDRLEGTINYASVYESVREEMNIPSLLLEHVGGRILQRLFRDFPTIEKIQLRLIKCNPPMGADCEGAGIEIEMGRAEKSPSE